MSNPPRRWRKVRCDEQHPRCSNCERLNLECKWRPPPSFMTPKKAGTSEPGPSPVAGANTAAQSAVHSLPSEPGGSPGSTPRLQNPEAMDQLFDFASFMWDTGDVLWPGRPTGAHDGFGPGMEFMVSPCRPICSCRFFCFSPRQLLISRVIEPAANPQRRTKRVSNKPSCHRHRSQPK